MTNSNFKCLAAEDTARTGSRSRGDFGGSHCGRRGCSPMRSPKRKNTSLKLCFIVLSPV